MGQKILTARAEAILLAAKRDTAITGQYYLTGGTALSYYYLHHRISEDLDFFSHIEPDGNMLAKWVHGVAKATHAGDVEFQTLNGQFVYYIHYDDEVVKIDFAQYPFEHAGNFHMDMSLRVASLLDIGINKLQAIQTRARGRDYVDIYTIIHEGNIPLSDLQQGYRIKIDMHVAPEEWAKYFVKILDATDQPRFLGTLKWDAVQKYFLHEARMLGKAVME